MRTGQRLAVPRGGITPISLASNHTISATMIVAAITVASKPWRANLRAASARRECEGGRTNWIAESRTNVKSGVK
jgi:hypothetical protein